jgi:hypothetical protein
MLNRAFVRCVLLAIATCTAAAPIPRSSTGATTGTEPTAADACAEGQIGKDAFAALAISALRRAGFDRPVNYDRDGFRLLIDFADKRSVRAFLGNAQRDYCKSSDDREREAVLRHFSSLWIGLDTVKPGAMADSLLPAVRGRAYFELTKLQEALDGDGKMEEHYLITLGSDIAVTVARDSGDLVGLLTDSSYSELGIGKDAAMTTALQNLRERSNDNWIEVGPSLFQSGWHDYYVPDLIRRLPIRGNPVAIAVDTDTLFVTGSENAQALLEMSERAGKAFAQARRPISGQAVTLVNGQWVDFVPQDPALQTLADLRRESRYADYAQQTELLQKIYGKRGDDVFVAPYDLFRKGSTAPLTSFSTWAGGIVTVLPRTDVIGFVENQSAPPFIVPWDAVQEIVGRRMTETGDYPPRYRVESFPNAAELARLRKAAM